MILIINLELRSTVSTSFLFSACKKALEFELNPHCRDVEYCHVIMCGPIDRNFLHFEKTPKTLTHESIQTLTPYLHFYSGCDIDTRYLGAKTILGASGRIVSRFEALGLTRDRWRRH